jgi:Secretion system C-terminal sorting domain/Electron transfer DM13
MKNFNLLFTVTTLVILQSTYSQCSRNANGFGNNVGTPTYNITGGVEVVLNTNNTLTLNLASDFMTAAGPDVRAYLVNPGTLTTAQLRTANINSLERIMFGIVSASGATPPLSPNGSKTFTVAVPTGITIANYTKVFFYCQMFNAFWDLGTIANFTPVNCAALSLDEVAETSFKVYPNPVIDELTINLDNFSNSLKVTIYNTLGSLVLSKNDITSNSNKINVSQLNQGIYFLSIRDDENNTLTKRFIKSN